MLYYYSPFSLIMKNGNSFFGRFRFVILYPFFFPFSIEVKVERVK